MLNWLRSLFSKQSSATNTTSTETTTTTQNEELVKYLIVGLGNVGDKYDDTRHNIGFDVVDQLAEKYNANFSLERHAFKATARYKSRELVLIKPTTYMNLSGKAVRYWMQQYKIPQERVLIIVDDKDLPLVKLRLRSKGSAGGHNGLRNIEEVLGNNQYTRLRFGIGNNFPRGKQVQFVLGKWKDDEAAALPEGINRAIEIIESFVAIGVERTMSLYNKK